MDQAAATWVEAVQGDALDAAGLAHVDVVARAELADRLVAGVLVADAAEEVVEEALAHRAAGGRHLLDAEALEQREEDGDAAGQHAGAVGLDAGDRGDLGGAAGGDQGLLELAQAGEGDAAVAPAVLTQEGVDRRGSCRRSRRSCPSRPRGSGARSARA
jgi:hypothetical protein